MNFDKQVFEFCNTLPDASTLKGVRLINTHYYPDSRGFFMESWSVAECQRIGIGVPVQENIVYSTRGVLRGMHSQNPPQGKLIRCLKGRIFDAIADPETGKWCAFVLDASKPSAVWVPRGYAHGYYVMSDDALVAYAVDAPWAIDGEIIYPWDSFGIDWPLTSEPVLSRKDREALRG